MYKIHLSNSNFFCEYIVKRYEKLGFICKIILLRGCVVENTSEKKEEFLDNETQTRTKSYLPHKNIFQLFNLETLS